MANSKIMWAVIGVLLVGTLFLTLKASALGSGGTGAAVNAGTGGLDTTGWTANEIMNYEMHGTIPARARGSAPPAKTSSAPTMVGGC